MTKNNDVLNGYISHISQRIDWLITACSGSVMARENAKDHLNQTVNEIITEVYNYGFIQGEKSAKSFYAQKNIVSKYKTKKQTIKETKKEILDMILKEYGLKDKTKNDRLKRKVFRDEVEMEEEF